MTSQRADFQNVVSRHRSVVPRPYAYDGDEGDGHEDDVQAEEQAVDDGADHLPVLGLFAPSEVTVHLEANGPEVSAQVPQFIQHRLLRDDLLRSRVTQDALKSAAGDDACGWFCHHGWEREPRPIQVSLFVSCELKA